MTEPSHRPRPTLVSLRDESIRALVASERAVERGFNEARLFASLAVALLLAGFLLVAQWRGNATAAQELGRQTDQNLAIIIGELTTENAALRNEVMRLELRVSEAEREVVDRSALLNDAALELEAIKAVSGLDAVKGPGVRIELADPGRVLLPQDFVGLINELRAGGAEAVAINGVRVGAAAGFRGREGSISLRGTTLAGPYTIDAIGDPALLEQSLELPGGWKSTLSTFPGVDVTIAREDSMRLAAADMDEFEFGRPREE